MHGGRHKTEAKLGEHVRKALSPAEVAPKQKHVRACVMFAWDCQTSEPLWTAIGMQPMLSDSVVCYKGLAVVHRVLVGGPHVVLSEALAHRTLLESCARSHGSTGLGYGPLIAAYVSFLQAKLEFHRLHASFTGNFDYEEYVSVRGVANLDEGYETVNNLLSVMDRMEQLERSVLGTGALSECRIAPLVPLVEESHGVFKFVTSMLDALVRVVPDASVLLPLVERYCKHMRTLRSFYDDCRRIHYLAALVDIPVLPPEPSFVPVVQRRSPETRVVAAPVVRAPSPKIVVSPEAPKALVVKKEAPLVDLLGDIEDGKDTVNTTSSHVHGREEVATHVHTVTTVPVHDARLVAELEAASMRAAAAEAEVSRLAAEHARLSEMVVSAQNHVAAYAQRDTAMADEAEDLRRRLAHAEVRLATAASPGVGERLAAEAEAHASAAVAEAARWKAKFEGLSTLYAGLRGEHLALLSRLDASVSGDSSPANQSAASPALLDDEMAGVSRAVEAAAERIALLRTSAGATAAHAAVVDGAAGITDAVSALIRAAIKAQRAVVAAGRSSGLSSAEFYRANSAWTQGLVSAARAVGAATSMLVDVADGALAGTHGLHHVVAALSSLGAATAQLLTASRVKALDLREADLPGLETAARAVTESSRRLADTSSSLMDAEDQEPSVGAKSGDAFGLRVEELEKQARVLALERELAVARGDLAATRRAAYERPADADVGGAHIDAGSGDDNDQLAAGSQLLHPIHGQSGDSVSGAAPGASSPHPANSSTEDVDDVFSSLLAIGTVSATTPTTLSPAQPQASAIVQSTDANPWRRKDDDLLCDINTDIPLDDGSVLVDGSKHSPRQPPATQPCPNEASAHQ